MIRPPVAEHFGGFGNGAELGIWDHGAMILPVVLPNKYVFRTWRASAPPTG